MVIKYKVEYNSKEKTFDELAEAMTFFQLYCKLGYTVKLFEVKHELYNTTEKLIIDSASSGISFNTSDIIKF